jgi:purine-binding chemotaxis protein CheW
MLLFEVGGRLYGCGIDAVREIIPFRACTRLPGAPSFVCGLINLRGTITTVLDLARRLEAGEVDRAEGSIVLVEHGAKTVGVGVDRVLDVQPVASSEIEPATGDDARGGIAQGLVHLGGDVVVLLDVRQLVKQVLL